MKTPPAEPGVAGASLQRAGSPLAEPRELWPWTAWAAWAAWAAGASSPPREQLGGCRGSLMGAGPKLRRRSPRPAAFVAQPWLLAGSTRSSLRARGVGALGRDSPGEGCGAREPRPPPAVPVY